MWAAATLWCGPLRLVPDEPVLRLHAAGWQLVEAAGACRASCRPASARVLVRCLDVSSRPLQLVQLAWVVWGGAVRGRPLAGAWRSGRRWARGCAQPSSRGAEARSLPLRGTTWVRPSSQHRGWIAWPCARQPGSPVWGRRVEPGVLWRGGVRAAPCRALGLASAASASASPWPGRLGAVVEARRRRAERAVGWRVRCAD